MREIVSSLTIGGAVNRQREDVGRGLIARAIISLSLGDKEKYQYSVRGNLCRNL